MAGIGKKVTSVALSRDERWALTGDDGWEVELHEAQSGQPCASGVAG